MGNATQYFNYLSRQIVRLNNQGIQEIKEFKYFISFHLGYLIFLPDFFNSSRINKVNRRKFAIN